MIWPNGEASLRNGAKILPFSDKLRHSVVYLGGRSCQRTVLQRVSGTELDLGVFECTPVRITAGDGDPDFAYGDAYLSADTQQLQTNGFVL